MVHIPVLVFETDPASSELLDIVLTRHGILHVSCLVPLKRGESPPAEYFRNVLEEHCPKLLITSWREIGTVVRFAERKMAKPRPVEKWIVSSYSMQTLENHRADTWADEILHKPISPIDFAIKVERRLKSLKVPELV